MLSIECVFKIVSYNSEVKPGSDGDVCPRGRSIIRSRARARRGGFIFLFLFEIKFKHVNSAVKRARALFPFL